VRRKAINFDLDTETLKKAYQGKNYRDAYTDINRFMQDRCFSHAQWSGYVSNNPMKYVDVIKIVEGLKNEFPWMGQAVNKFDITEVGAIYSLGGFFRSSEDISIDNIRKLSKLERIKAMGNRSEKRNDESVKHIEIEDR
jgi:virulence-associated protein VapD